MFIDASAMVAILTAEPGHQALITRLEAAPDKSTSAIAIWETAVRLTTKSSLSGPEAQAIVDQFLFVSSIAVVDITAVEAKLAIEAYTSYGKRRHPADLNMGDCFAYACAKARGKQLLYVGNDFALTDVNGGY